MKTQQEELTEYVLSLAEGKKLSLVNIKNGAVIEAFDRALAEVVQNCVDINTTRAAREITIKVKVVPTKDRDMIGITLAVDRKLAGMEPIEATANIAIDAAGKGHIAERRQDPQQLDVFGNVQPLKGNQ